MKLMEKAQHFLLYSLSFYILEPLFLSGRWRVREGAKERLQPAVLKLHEVFEDSQRFFERINMCAACDGSCCHGDFNRFSVLDHVAHLACGAADQPVWGYRLYPWGSYEFNRNDEGLCPVLQKGAGCAIEFRLRPAVCIWWICEPMDAAFTAEQKRYLQQLRQKIDAVHWQFVRVLLCGGMERVG